MLRSDSNGVSLRCEFTRDRCYYILERMLLNLPKRSALEEHDNVCWRMLKCFSQIKCWVELWQIFSSMSDCEAESKGWSPGPVEEYWSHPCSYSGVSKCSLRLCIEMRFLLSIPWWFGYIISAFMDSVIMNSVYNRNVSNCILCSARSDSIIKVAGMSYLT